MSDFIEITLPEKGPRIIAKRHITTIGYSDASTEPCVTIGIQGWVKPILNSGPDAKAWYDSLRHALNPQSVTSLKPEPGIRFV